MVEIAEIQEQEETTMTSPASAERLLDAQEIESLAQTASRVSVRLHLESLAKKLRKESEALSRVEKSKGVMGQEQQQQQSSSADAPPTTTTAEMTTAAAAAVAAAPMPAPSVPPQPIPVASSVAAVIPGGKYTPIDRFSFDFGGYDSAFVSIYIALPSVGSIPKDQISCQFTKDSFDLIINNLQGKSYRLFKDHLEKNINPEKSKFVVKADKIIVKLAKCKGEYGSSYEYWTKLTDPKKKQKSSSSSSKENPQASIMELMRDMYEDGDDNLKKVIGETMMKQQRGELGKDPMGGLGDMKLGGDDDF